MHALLDSCLCTVVGISRKIRRTRGRKAKNGEVHEEVCRKADERMFSSFQENPLDFFWHPYRKSNTSGLVSVY